MAVGYAGHGGLAAIAAQTISPAYPTGVTVGDCLILTRACKPDTGVLLAPAGWTLLDERAGGAGVFGSDTGPLRMARYWREATGTETGTLPCDTAPGTVDIQQAVITRYTKAAGTTWDVAGSGGVDSTTNTDWTVTAATNPGITAGDVVEVALSWPTDAARTWSAETLTATGATIGPVMVPLVFASTSLGADMATRLHAFGCTAGTATAPPVYNATVNGGTNIAGPTSMVRLRETPSGGPATVSLSPASMTLGAVPVAATPGPVTAMLTPAVVAFTARPVTAAPGVITVTLIPAAVVLAARPVTSTPGPITVPLAPASVAITATTVGTPTADGTIPGLLDPTTYRPALWAETRQPVLTADTERG